MKYGSLSSEDGRITIGWLWASKGGERRFLFTWTEHGGPPVEEPARDGFGRAVIERAAAQAVGGQVALAYDPSGLRWTLDAPEDQVVFPPDTDRTGA